MDKAFQAMKYKAWKAFLCFASECFCILMDSADHFKTVY